MDVSNIDIAGLVAWLRMLEARGVYDGLTVRTKLESLGFTSDQLPTYGETVSGMVLSSDLVRKLGAPHPGSYGGWGFQHTANITAIAKLDRNDGPDSMKELLSF